MTRRMYSGDESLNRLARILKDEVPTSDIPGSLVGEYDSWNQALSDIAELFADSLPGETLTFPDANFSAITTDENIIVSGTITAEDIVAQGTLTFGTVGVASLGASGNIWASGTMTAEDMFVRDDLTVGDDVFVGGDVNVTGTVTAEDILVQDDLTVDGSVYVGESVYVTGTITAETGHIEDDLTVDEEIYVGDDLFVGGDATVTGTVTAETGHIEDDLTVDEEIYVGDDLFVGGDAFITGTVTAETGHIEDDLTVDEEIYVGDDLFVGGDANITGTVTAEDGIIRDDLYVEDDIIGGGDLTITGTMTANDYKNIPHEHGAIYNASATGTASIVLGTAWSKLTGTLISNGVSTSNITPTGANDRIVINKAGTYMVLFQLAFSGTNNSDWNFAAYVDSVRQEQIRTARKLGAAGDRGSCSAFGFVTITGTNNAIEVYGNAQAATQTFQLHAGQLIVEGDLAE